MRKFFISYARKDRKWADSIRAELSKNTHNEVFFDEYIFCGDNFIKEIADRIEKCDVMIIIISNNFMCSEHCKNEYANIIHISEKAALQIIPIYIECPNEANMSIQMYLDTMQGIFATENESPEALSERVSSLFAVQDRISELYVAAEGYRFYGSYYDACMCCQEIIQLLNDSFFDTPEQRIAIYNRMGEIYQESYECYRNSTDLHGARVSYSHALELAQKYFGEDQSLTANIYMALGTLHSTTLPEDALTYYTRAYEILKRIPDSNEGTVSECQRNIEVLKEQLSQGIFEQCSGQIHDDKQETVLYEKIANYHTATLELFQELLKQDSSPAAIDCLKTSYTRLMNYCKITGGLENVISICTQELQKLNDLSAMAKKSYCDDSRQLKAFKNYLGKETPSHVSYDIFVSYKSEDILLAKRIVQYLKDNGKKVFFSAESLSELGRSEYTKAIDDALDHSKHLLVVATDLDYLSTGWVEHEWGFFCFEKIEHRKNGEIVLVLDDDISMKKDDFPASLRHFHVCPTSEFRSKILNFVF